MAASLTFEELGGGPRQLFAKHARDVREAWAGERLAFERLTSDAGLTGCLCCAHPELYTEVDFPKRTGLLVVVLAAALAPATHYLSLLAAAAVDAALYRFSRPVVVCYVCRARHRGFAREPRHPRFDLGIAERMRYGPKAVMGTPMRPGGTAGAPEPEH